MCYCHGIFYSSDVDRIDVPRRAVRQDVREKFDGEPLARNLPRLFCASRLFPAAATRLVNSPGKSRLADVARNDVRSGIEVAATFNNRDRPIDPLSSSYF